jgi:tetratricopeptide (TPR) repeat protein
MVGGFRGLVRGLARRVASPPVEAVPAPVERPASKVVGFWSYSRSDDVDSHGWLTQVRAYVSAALRHESGDQDTRIWQDDGFFPTGAAWEPRIAEVIGQSTFFLPIITRRYLRSAWCCRELLIFHQRAAAEGWSGRIFPIQYGDVGPPERLTAADCYDPAVLPILRAVQWIDVSDAALRASSLLDPTDPDAHFMRTRLYELAGHIFATLSSPAGVVVPPAANPRSAGARVPSPDTAAATGQLEDAAAMFRRALAIDEASLGPDHPNVAVGLSNLAALLRATNRLAEAEPMFRRALAIDEASLGPDHPNIAIRLSNLAALLRSNSGPRSAS